MAALPALALIVHDAETARRGAAEQATQSVLQLVRTVAHYQRDLDRQTHTLVNFLARDPSVLSGDHAACNARFADLLFNAVNEPDHFFNFVAINLDGDIYCASRQGTPSNMHVRNRSYFWQVLERKTVVTGEYVFGKIINAPVVPVAGPIMADGEMKGVLLVTTNLAWIAKTMAPRLPPAAALRLYDSRGTILVRVPDHGAAVGTTDTIFSLLTSGADEGTFRRRSEAGEERLYAYSRLPYGDHSFYVAVDVPAANLFAEADAGLRRALTTLVGVMVAVMVAAWAIGNSLILRSVASLTGAVRHMAAGDLSTRVTMDRQDEIGLLGDAFNEMAGALQASAHEAELREAALREAMAEAERANDAKTRFLAAASHDLRQPLQALNLYLGVIAPKVSAAEAPIIGHMELCLSSLSELLGRLLDLSKLDAGVVVPNVSDFALDDLLSRVVSAHVPNAETKGLHLRMVASSVIGHTDPVLFGRMVANLVSNAIRYTERGGVVVGCRRRDGVVWVEVCDSGIGIPEDKTEIIFEEFQQLGNAERSREKGSGLGLAIVAKTAALLNLRIRVSSRLGRGSTFAIELPVAELRGGQRMGHSDGGHPSLAAAR